jgi:hypothetical protein
MSDVALSSGWQAIHGLQHYLENNKWVDAASLAAEQALTDVLDAFIAVKNVTDAEINRSFHSRRMNRRRRNRHRETLLKDHAEQTIMPSCQERICDASIEAEDRDFWVNFKQNMNATNFAILNRLANGELCSEIALDFGVSAAAIRTKACRAREIARNLAA